MLFWIQCTRSIDCKGQRSRKGPSCLSSPTKLALIAEGGKCHGQEAIALSFSSAEYQISRVPPFPNTKWVATTWHRYNLDMDGNELNEEIHYYNFELSFGIDVSCNVQIKQSKEYYIIKMEKFSSSYLYVDCGMNKLYFLRNDLLRGRCCRFIICSYFRHKPYH